ncbi:MAG TPA: DNA-deoxyinosine glycosylase [Stenotrophomonas sp.]
MDVIERSVVRGLAAQIRSDCRVLVLGSMPGVASLRATQYYAHPRNRFWPLMSRLLAVDGPGYDERVAQLQAAGIGLWDVVGQCARVGSLDAAIERDSVVPNPLPECLAELGQLRVVACNGAEAHRLWQRWVAPRLPRGAQAIPLLALPSTSPANAAFSLERLAGEWQRLLGFLPPPGAR